MKTLAPTAAEARVVRMLRALANPARFRIVELLADRKDCTTVQLLESLPLAQSSLFDHLAALRDVGIVQTSGDGPHRYYCVDPQAIEFVAAYLSGLAQRTRSWSGFPKTPKTPMTPTTRTTPPTPAHSSPREQRMHIRDAVRADAAAIAHIYNQGIEDRVATLETQLRSPEERRAWMAARSHRHPVLVAVDGADAVVGWASLNQFNPRPVYGHVADLSVYVAREHRGRGIGDALLGGLVQRARHLGYHKLVLAAFPTNAPGMRLYERHGFQQVGIYHEQGLLDGRWVDVVVMEKLLDR